MEPSHCWSPRATDSRGSAPSPAPLVAAYEQAAIDPADLVVEVHDAAAPGELIVYEDIGIAGPGLTQAIPP
jgi:acetyl-CoA acyltransferase